MYKIENEKLPALFSAVSGYMDLYLPLRRKGQAGYGIWAEGETPALEELNTVSSPKDFFFPQSENLYTCYREGKKLSIEPEELKDKPFALFGIRACDAKGLEILDRVFLAEPADTFYQARREQGILITRACGEPEETCFCTAFGIDPTEPAGDVSTWTVGEFLCWEPRTQKGRELTEKLSGLLKPADEADEKALEAWKGEAGAAADRLPYGKLDLEPFCRAELLDLFHSPKWQELYPACLGCGTCTFICPTCQCYDIRDYDTGSGVRRFRCWDSCMYSDFTLMAHGNIRTTQMERFRQRFMHKLVYFPENNGGVFSCVGCGRCLKKCPSSLNIVKVIKSLGGQEHE